MTRDDRRAAINRWRDYALGAVLIGRIGAAANQRQRFAYISFLPDSIREYADRPDFSRRLQEWLRDNARRNAGDIARLLFFIQNAEQVIDEDVAGDFAELGVHMGHSAKVLADVIAAHEADRRLYLFDTFEGFDERDLDGVDADQPAIYGDTSLLTVQQYIGHGDVCRYRPGYFPDTAEGMPSDATFALVHLDCDLYEPTRAALDFFYPRLSTGALVIVHDYSSGHWPGVPQAVHEFLTDKPERLLLLPDKSGSAVFRKI